MGPKCNIGSIEGAVIFSKMSGYLDHDEERQFLSKFTAYCFYETWGTKNHREGYCTLCGEHFSVYKDENPGFFAIHHNGYGRCPCCGETVELKCLGRMQSGAGLRESLAAAFIRPAEDGGIYISAGIGFREFQLWSGSAVPELDYIEKARYYMAPGRVKGWKRSIRRLCYREMFGTSDWVEMVNITEPFRRNTLYGFDNDHWLFGTEHLEDTAFKYCQLEDWHHAETANWICEQENTVKLAVSYLANYAMRPQMEMAVKLGLPELCTDLCEGRTNGRDINWKAKKPWDFLRMEKTEAKSFLTAPDMGLLRALHLAKREGYKASVDELRGELHSVGKVGFNELIACAGRCHVTLNRALDYTAAHGTNGVGLWKDYLDMAVKLGYDLSQRDVCMPKDLRGRHDAAAATIKVEQDEKSRLVYKKRYVALVQKYAFEMDGYRIIVPLSADEIVREGKTLGHCVGGYAARHVEGKTTILFFRRSRKPGTSFITLEMMGVNGDQIRQIHGYRNEGYKGAVSPSVRYEHFLNTWREWLRGGSKRDADGKPIIKQEVKTA